MVGIWAGSRGEIPEEARVKTMTQAFYHMPLSPPNSSLKFTSWRLYHPVGREERRKKGKERKRETYSYFSSQLKQTKTRSQELGTLQKDLATIQINFFKGQGFLRAQSYKLQTLLRYHMATRLPKKAIKNPFLTVKS